MHLHETEWELNSFLKLNMQTTYLSGSYGSIILYLYVTDIFEQEPCGQYPELNMCLTYLSGSHVDVIHILYVTDIFEWEQYVCYPKT